MITRNRIDWLVRSTGPTEIIDIRETGGAEESQLVVQREGGGTATIEGADEQNGTYADVATVTVPATGEYRERVPLECPRFIRLKATGAILTIRY